MSELFPEISIIIVSYNVGQLLLECIQSIYRTCPPITFEIIVVDNASSYNIVKTLSTEFPQVKFIQNEHNIGFAAANNLGLEIAQAPYVLLLNPDTVVLDQSLQILKAFMDQNPAVAVVGPELLNPDHSLQRAGYVFPSLLSIFENYTAWPWLSKFRRRPYPLNRSPIQSCEVDFISGAAFLVRAQAVQDVGGLDQDYFMYAEEADWCWRFWKAGWSIWFLPDAKIIHYGGASVAQDKNRISASKLWLPVFYNSEQHFFKKNYGLLVAFLGKIARLVFLTLALVKSCFIALIREESRDHIRFLLSHWTAVFQASEYGNNTSDDSAIH